MKLSGRFEKIHVATDSDQFNLYEVKIELKTKVTKTKAEELRKSFLKLGIDVDLSWVSGSERAILTFKD